MSKSLSLGYTDTAFGSPLGATFVFPRRYINLTADWAVKSNTPGEAIMTNITSPADRIEKIRIGFSEVADIYKGSGIDPAYYAPSRKGVSVVSQITEVGRITESTDASFVDVPLSAHLVIKAPSNELITVAVVQTLLSGLISTLFPENSIATTRLNAMLRGVTVPPEL